ncbi:MAG: hypothetical protein WD101_01215 [Gemmatimonadota bacterium]
MTPAVRRLLLLTLLMAAWPHSVASQERVSPGAEVRVSAPSVELVDHRGTLDDVTTDFLRVDGIRIPREAITKLEVGRDVSNFLRFAGIGLLTGVALGTAACLNECPTNDSDITRGGLMVMYAGVAGGAGLALGAVVGGVTRRTEWRTVPDGSLQPSLATTPDGRVLLGLRIRF